MSTHTFQNITREELVIRRIFDDPIIQNRVLPHLKTELFEDSANRSICSAILQGYRKYNNFPQAQDLVIAFGVNSPERNKLLKIMGYTVDKLDAKMAIDYIEAFFKERKTELVLVEAAESIHERDFKNISSLISDLEESINFSLYFNVGLNLVKDTEEALKRLNETHKPVLSALEPIRVWTSNKRNGGWYRSALSVIQGMPNVGKTIMMCNEAAYAYTKGHKVLYVSLELAEEHIWERIAVNVANIPIYDIRAESADEIKELLKEDKKEHDLNKKEDDLKYGELVVRQLPSTTTVLDIENLMNEIKVSEGFDIDILFVDYIGKMKPAKRVGGIQQSSLYILGKEISEQLRDFAIKYEIPVVTANQLNKEGYSSVSADMKNTSLSAAINDTADLMITVTQDPHLEKQSMFLHMIIKNRFGPKYKVFLTECEYQYMRVRAAPDQKVSDYRDSQINQNIEIHDFTQKIGDVAIKDEESGGVQGERATEYDGIKNKLGKNTEEQHTFVIPQEVDKFAEHRKKRKESQE